MIERQSPELSPDARREEEWRALAKNLYNRTEHIVSTQSAARRGEISQERADMEVLDAFNSLRELLLERAGIPQHWYSGYSSERDG